MCNICASKKEHDLRVVMAHRDFPIFEFLGANPEVSELFWDMLFGRHLSDAELNLLGTVVTTWIEDSGLI